MVSYQAARIFAPGMNILHTAFSLCMFLISISAATREKQKLTAAIHFLGTPKAFSLQNVKFYLERAIAPPKPTAFEGRSLFYPPEVNCWCAVRTLQEIRAIAPPNNPSALVPSTSAANLTFGTHY
jgi:hypothetical protein